jgi:hypothetical protein
MIAYQVVANKMKLNEASRHTTHNSKHACLLKKKTVLTDELMMKKIDLNTDIPYFQVHLDKCHLKGFLMKT